MSAPMQSTLAGEEQPPGELRPGQVLGERYTLVRRLAAGGMGEVWHASDRVLGREVALKTVHSGLRSSSRALDRFRKEAQHAAALAHSGIASVHDYGEDMVDGAIVPYLVMELVPGTPLSSILGLHGRLPEDVTLSIVGQAADALAAAHAAGVVHCDVKPANLIVLDDDRVKLTDFGIAVAHGSSESLLEGTPPYMAPEQVRGDPPTPASDVYSLGVVAWEMLTGQRPSAPEPGRLPEPPPLAALDGCTQPLRELVRLLTQPDPTLRPPDGAEAARRVAAVQDEMHAPRTVQWTRVLAPVDHLEPAPTAIATAGWFDTPPPSPRPPDDMILSEESRPVALWQPRSSRPRRAKRPAERRRLVALLAVAAVVLGAFVIGVATSNSLPVRDRSTVPARRPATTTPVDIREADFLGVPVSDAVAVLRAAGLTVTVNRVESQAWEPDVVIGLAPEGRLVRGDSVTLAVTQRPPESSPDDSDDD